MRLYAGGGANIGLGIPMMFSPLPMAGASLLLLITVAEGRSPDEKASGSLPPFADNLTCLTAHRILGVCSNQLSQNPYSDAMTRHR